jgi:hypothetical protein
MGVEVGAMQRLAQGALGGSGAGGDNDEARRDPGTARDGRSFLLLSVDPPDARRASPEEKLAGGAGAEVSAFEG